MWHVHALVVPLFSLWACGQKASDPYQPTPSELTTHRYCVRSTHVTGDKLLGISAGYLVLFGALLRTTAVDTAGVVLVHKRAIETINTGINRAFHRVFAFLPSWRVLARTPFLFRVCPLYTLLIVCTNYCCTSAVTR